MKVDIHSYLDISLGLRIIESVFCTIPQEKVVERTWRDRFWSWPWKPWISHKVVEETVPDPSVYIVQDQGFGQSVVCHPTTAAAIRQAVQAGG